MDIESIPCRVIGSGMDMESYPIGYPFTRYYKIKKKKILALFGYYKFQYPTVLSFMKFNLFQTLCGCVLDLNLFLIWFEFVENEITMMKEKKRI